jgi:hypothetical protein
MNKKIYLSLKMISRFYRNIKVILIWKNLQSLLIRKMKDDHQYAWWTQADI